MNLVAKEINDKMAFRLFTEISVHTYEFGGTTVEIYGSKGSAKTSLMLRLASKLVCETYNDSKMVAILPSGEEIRVKPEQVIWRGRLVDQWTWYPKQSEVMVFIHKADDVVFYTEDGQEFEVRFKRYRNVDDLYRKVRESGYKLNVVYEPREYEIGEDLVDLMMRRATLPKRVFKDIEVDSTIWWYELIAYLLERHDNDFISVMIDEADEVFPENPSGLRWHLQLWLKDNVKDLRKRNVSLYFSAHSHVDIDSRIRTKMQYRILMKGAKVPEGSLLRGKKKIQTLFLKPGQAYIERDGYGKFKFDPLPQRPKVVARFLNNQS